MPITLPDPNAMRDYRITTETTPDGGALGQLPVDAMIRNDVGAVPAGALFALLDSTAGRLALRASAPDVVATHEMGFQAIRAAARGPVVARARTLRQGRRTLALEVSMWDGDEDTAPEIATGTASFTRVPIPEGIIVDTSDGPTSLGEASPRAQQPLLERLGVVLEDPAAGAVRLDVHDYVRNHLNVVLGAALATLAERSAEHAARHATGARLTVLDLAVQYLALARTGPVRTAARVVRQSETSATCRVSIYDAGEGDRLVALATATAGLPLHST